MYVNHIVTKVPTIPHAIKILVIKFIVSKLQNLSQLIDTVLVYCIS